MSELKPHLEEIFGFFAIVVAATAAQGAAYVFSLAVGDVIFVILSFALTFYCVRYGAKMEGLAFSSLVSMCLAFGLTGTFALIAWNTRTILFDLQLSFDASGARSAIILTLILPLVLIAITVPPAIKLLRAAKTDVSPDAER